MSLWHQVLEGAHLLLKSQTSGEVTRFTVTLFVIYCISSLIRRNHLSAKLLLHVFLFSDLKDDLVPFFPLYLLPETKISYSVLSSGGQLSLFSLIFQLQSFLYVNIHGM